MFKSELEAWDPGITSPEDRGTNGCKVRYKKHIHMFSSMIQHTLLQPLRFSSACIPHIVRHTPARGLETQQYELFFKYTSSELAAMSLVFRHFASFAALIHMLYLPNGNIAAPRVACIFFALKMPPFGAVFLADDPPTALH